MSALSVAFGIQHDLDLECLVHCTTRDRNLMALESELLGAHALGVRNIIALTGDPPRIGDYPTDDRRVGRRFDRVDRDPDQAQPRRRHVRRVDRPACRVHDRVRARLDGRRPGEGMGPARTEARGWCAPRDDPAALLGSPGRGDAPRGAAAIRAARHTRSRSCSGCSHSSPPAMPSSSTTRCPGSRSPTRRARRCEPPASAAPRWGSTWPIGSWRRWKARSPGPTSCRASGGTSNAPSSSAGSGRGTLRRRGCAPRLRRRSRRTERRRHDVRRHARDHALRSSTRHARTRA